ncbi:secreted protein [Beggiatoa sp. PS]|nr:secreted protein [Beggiatoa sp. PS]
MRLCYFLFFCLLLQNLAYGDDNNKFDEPVLRITPNANEINPYGNNRFNNTFPGNVPNANGINPHGNNQFRNPLLGTNPNTNEFNSYKGNQFNNPYTNRPNLYGGNQSNNPLVGTPNTNRFDSYRDNQPNHPLFRNTPNTNGLNPYRDIEVNTTPTTDYNNDIYSPSTSNNSSTIPFGIIFWLGVIIFFVIKAVFFSGSKSGNSRTLSRGGQPYIDVRCIKRNEPIPELPGRTVELIRVSVGGQAIFPHENATVTYRVRLVDVTEGDQNPQPIICYIPELSDAEGIFTFDIEAELPYAFATFDNIELVQIPTEVIVAPKKGQRRIKVLVGITPSDSVEWFYVDGETTINFIQQTYGWMEFQEAVANQESKLATLALCFASINGIIGKPEATTIKKYFSELYTNAENVDTRKQKVNEAMKDTLARLKNRQQPREVIQRICDELLRENSAPLSQQAYEICVRVAVADGKLESSKEEMLSYISGKLELAKEFVTEIHDRYISISMRQHNDNMSIFDILGMPIGLSKDQKLEWIQTQYRKWRNRVTNKDSKISAEASLMLGMLSKARTQLMSES